MPDFGFVRALAHVARIIGVAAASLLLHAEAYAASQPISIQQFSSKGAYGTQVANPLPIYTLHISNGKLVDSNGVTFNSYLPQWTTSSPQWSPVAGSGCIIPNLRWAAVYTTFYVVLASDPDHMRVVRSCGKSPLQLNSNAQYSNIGSGNFINHAQIAGAINGNTNNVNQVIAAGELDVINGKIVYMDTCSGHFQPNVGSFLAYASGLDEGGVLSLTSSLKSIIQSGSISDQQISANLTPMVSGGTTPSRNVRVGTSGCYSYTTVFAIGTSNGTTTLSGGLLALNQGGVQVFMNNINAITNQNVKDITLTGNCCIYSYAANVITDLHFWNNALNFTFTDETNDTYSLSVHVYSYNHEVDYNSAKPNINKITFDWAPSSSSSSSSQPKDEL
ncbi:hypothetical protein P6144_02560 [Sphingomonas sp. HITSZ_GF]|uniref:hypothetical protein n=1 Tax=Sphingomonas sp. HITSZ_GF TaxID=3037247 RepID=UPI00240DD97B|nr:hypothetical protein [Sphingomonas sp. HITSZ_GF]MDG2532516.1 hypothetical protein [Sphingomonas sp. HITSZ_GF]